MIYKTTARGKLPNSQGGIDLRIFESYLVYTGTNKPDRIYSLFFFKNPMVFQVLYDVREPVGKALKKAFRAITNRFPLLLFR